MVASKGTGTCPVCSRPTTNHIYYGARVCISCRGFFRRSVQNDHYPLFDCKRGKECPIDSTSRKSCKWCRFQRCLEAGMRMGWVMSEKERKDRVVSRINAENEKDQQQHAVAVPSPTLPQSARDLFYHISEAEISQIKNCYLHFEETCHLRYYNYFAKNLDQFSDFIALMTGRGKVTQHDVKTWSSLDEQAAKNFSFNMTEMTDFSPCDRMTLITQNFGMMFGLMISVYTRGEELARFLDDFARFGRRNRAQAASIDVLLRKMDEMSIGDFDIPNDKLGNFLDHYWETAFSPSPRKDIDTFFGLMERVETQVKGGDRAVDTIIAMLLFKIVLFHPEGMGMMLEDHERVKAVYDTNLWVLHRYLRTAYKDKAGKRMHELLLALDSAQKLYEISKGKCVT